MKNKIIHTDDWYFNLDVSRELPDVYNKIPEFKRPIYRIVKVWLNSGTAMKVEDSEEYVNRYKQYDDVVFVIRKCRNTNSCCVHRFDFFNYGGPSTLDSYYIKLISNLKARYGSEWEIHSGFINLDSTFIN